MLSLACCSALVLDAACSSSSGTAAVAVDAGSDSPSTCDKAPAAGYTQVVPPSADMTGTHTAMTLTKDGYPVIAYSVHMSADNKSEDYYVVRWDPCLGAWSTPLKFDTGNGLESGLPTRAISIALDPTDGRIGIAYMKDYNIVQANSTRAAFVTFSADGGKTSRRAPKSAFTPSSKARRPVTETQSTTPRSRFVAARPSSPITRRTRRAEPSVASPASSSRAAGPRVDRSLKRS